VSDLSPVPPAPAPAPGRTLGIKLALSLLRALTPLTGEARAQWIVGRLYATLYLVRFYLSVQYARATLGMIWVVLAPLLVVAVYMPVFVVVFKAKLPGRESVLDYALFTMIGLTAWSAFSDAIGQGAGALVFNQTIVRHSPTPPVMLPIVKVLTSFLMLGIGLTILGVVLLASGHSPGVRLVLLPAFFVLFFVFTLGLVLFLCVAAAYLHDLIQALPTLLSIEFFAAPIAYAPESATGLMYTLVRLNPLKPFLCLARAAMLPWYPFAWEDLWMSAAWAAGAFLVGAFTFRKLQSGLRDLV
jgi:lipopolysaccharide transport system permease protein